MASGATLVVFTPAANEPPTTSFATLDTRNGHLVLEFDAAADEAAVFASVLPRNYGGAGLTVAIHYLMDVATANAVVWGGSWERNQDGTTDLSSDNFASEKTVVETVPGTAGIIGVATLAFTDGGEIDLLSIGESFRFKLRRLGTDGSDTASGDAQLLRVEIRET